jgi:hypothetical protein
MTSCERDRTLSGVVENNPTISRVSCEPELDAVAMVLNKESLWDLPFMPFPLNHPSTKTARNDWRPSDVHVSRTVRSRGPRHWDRFHTVGRRVLVGIIVNLFETLVLLPFASVRIAGRGVAFVQAEDFDRA